MNKQFPVWSLQEAKAKFSEVVRRARSEGPQMVTVHGKNAVTISAAVASQDGGEAPETGAGLVDLLNNSPLRLLGKGEFKRTKLRARGRAITL